MIRTVVVAHGLAQPTASLFDRVVWAKLNKLHGYTRWLTQLVNYGQWWKTSRAASWLRRANQLGLGWMLVFCWTHSTCKRGKRPA